MIRILTTILCLGTLLWGCAIDDGRPWGKLSLSLTAQAPYTDARWDENLQALRTTDDARVRLDDITLTLTHISLFGKAGSQSNTFDPNNPPPPYTNCHSGHCHRTDNDALVSYEDIQAEMDAGNTQSAPVIVEASLDIPLLLDINKFSVPTLAEDFLISQIHHQAVSSASLTFETIAIKGSVKTKNADEWLDFEILVPNLSQTLSLNLKFDRGSTFHQKAHIVLSLNYAFLDNRQWHDLDQDETLAAAIAHAFFLELKP